MKKPRAKKKCVTIYNDIERQAEMKNEASRCEIDETARVSIIDNGDADDYIK